jgi:protein subunit release factor A
MGQDFNKVEAMVTELDELEVKLSDPATHSNPNEARRIGKRHAELKPVVAKYREWIQLRDDEIAAREMGEEDAAFLAEAESMAIAREAAAEKLQEMLIPRDPMDGNDVILEIKAGAGGEESALFAGDLMRMYLKFAEKRGWATQVLEAEESDMGGYKDIAIAVKSKGVVPPEDAPFANLKFEGGVHRVQRVPVTESQGRIHTSAAGVLVLPEAEEVDVTIDPNDLRIDVFRSSVRVDKVLTQPTLRFASHTFQLELWFRVRTKSHSFKIKNLRCVFFAPECWRLRKKLQWLLHRMLARVRFELLIARSESELITSQKTDWLITALDSRAIILMP